GPDTVVSAKSTGYPGNLAATTDSMSARTAASWPQTTPIPAGRRGTGRRGRRSSPSASRRARASAIIAAIAPSPTGTTSSATSCSWPQSVTHSRRPVTATRSPATTRQRARRADGTLTAICDTRSRRVNHWRPVRPLCGLCTSPSTATRPIAPAAWAMRPASRVRLIRRGPVSSVRSNRVTGRPCSRAGSPQVRWATTERGRVTGPGPRLCLRRGNDGRALDPVEGRLRGAASAAAGGVGTPRRRLAARRRERDVVGRAGGDEVAAEQLQPPRRVADVLQHEQALELVRRQRRAEQEPLHHVAPVGLQELHLLDGLDAFGGHLEVEAVAERNDARDERVLPAVGNALDERLVDLEPVEGQRRQRVERAVAGPEVVDRGVDAHLLQVEQRGACPVGVVLRQAFGQLELQ